MKVRVRVVVKVRVVVRDVKVRVKVVAGGYGGESGEHGGD